MSKTYKRNKTGDKYPNKTRIKPYATEVGKFTLNSAENPSFRNKEIVRNANRSLKKGLRQKYKKEIKKFLERL